VAQVGEIGAQLLLACALRQRAHDEAALLSRRQQLLQPLAQRLAAAFVLDALRDADVRVLRQVHQQAPGDRDLRRQARALGPDRVLHHLDEDRFALGQDLLDRLARLAVVPDVRHVQEGGARQPDLEERRLHAGQHARHAAHVDVADQAAARAALDEELLHHPGAGHRDPGFLRRDVDEDFLRHLRDSGSFSSSWAVS
jgi:hypothetical protein